MSNSIITTFNAPTINEQFLLLASHTPTGRFWEKVFDQNSNLGKLTISLCMEYYRLGVLSEKLPYEYDISQTTDLILEWEASVGVPSKCFNTYQSIERRRQNIEAIFSNFGGAQTKSDFERVGLLFGYDVNVEAGIDVSSFPIRFPLMFWDSTSLPFIIFINLQGVIESGSYFPLEMPFPFGGSIISFLDCIFKLISPANCEVFVRTDYRL